jgi:predicted dienelactone hydrolase
MSFDRYKVRGSFNPAFYCCDSTDDNITKYQIYYPQEMETLERRFPVVVVVNGINEPAYQYRHVFEHLASWGFIVVGNYDIDSWRGYSTHANLELLLQLNQTPDNIF